MPEASTDPNLPAAFKQRCAVQTPPWLVSSGDAGTPGISDADPSGAATAATLLEASAPPQLQRVVPASEATIADNAGQFTATFSSGAAQSPTVVFASKANDLTVLRDTKTGIELRFRIAQASHAQGIAKDGYLLYPGAGPKGADFVVRPKRDGVEDHIALASDPGEVVYEVQLGGPVAGLRLVSDTLELLDAGGDPRLHMSPPTVMGSDCVQLPVHVTLKGCNADASSAPPWGRSVTSPGANSCELHLSLPAATHYPALLDPSWSSTGNLISARYAHSGIALPNGNVLVAGGSNGWADYTSAELYSTSAGTWAAAGNMSAGRQGGWAVQVPAFNNGLHNYTQGAILAAGGWTTSNNTVDAYDLSTGQWSTLHVLTHSRRGAAVAYEPSSGTILVSGGDNTAEIYNKTNDTWASTASMNASHSAHTSTAMPDGTILVAGDYNFTTGAIGAAAEYYTPSSNTWTSVPMNHSVAFHTATGIPNSAGVANSMFVVAGGAAGTPAQIYTPASHSWSYFTSYPNTYQQSGIALLTGGRLGVAGGHDGTNSHNDTWLYGTNSATWTSLSLSPLFSARAVFPLVPISGGRALAPAGLILMGGTINAQTDSTILFDDCNDDNVCTTDTLSNGVCTHTFVAGVDDGNPCTTDLCNPVTGQVTHGAASAGISCSTSACLANQTCDGAGACSGGTANSIDDGNPCTTDSCNPTSGVTHTPLAVGSSCDDGNACNGSADTCQNGTGGTFGCLGHAANLAAGTACDDKNPCTTADQCNGSGSCTGTSFTDTISADGCTKTTCTASLGLTVGAAPDAGTGCAADAGVAPSTPVGEVSDLANDIPSFTTNQGINASVLYPDRISMIRGQVFFAPTLAALTATPPPGLVPAVGATVTAPGQPYGTATVRSDGWFDLAVNGAGPVVIRVSGPPTGTTYLSVERQATTRWKEFTVLDKIVLTPQEGAIAVTAPTTAPQMVTAGNSPADDGTARTPRVFFPQGLQANGSAVTSSFNLNVTEYTRQTSGGPAAMPGDLPPTSGYTYAVAISMSGYSSPVFPNANTSGPTPVLYLDNFTGLEVGRVVPSGSYNTTTHQWEPTTTGDAHLIGRVIKVISVVSGDAQLDVDGNGTIDNVDCSNPANSSALFCQMGFNTGEVTKLGGVTPSLVGQTLWRSPLPHFSDWDLNWGYAAPLAAIFSKAVAPSTNAALDNSCKKHSSIIECQNQILGEEVAIPGTPYSLSYRSDRQIGRKATIRVPLTDATTNLTTIGLKRIDATIDVAGNRFPYSTTSTANNQVFTYAWDRKDAYGRPVQGETTATVRVGYVYQGQTQNTAKFGAYGTGKITGDRAAREITLWNTYRIEIAGLNATALGLGGWTISPQHVYEPISGVTFFGDGERRHVEALVPTMRTIAGRCVGSTLVCPAANDTDGQTALAASLSSPAGVVRAT